MKFRAKKIEEPNEWVEGYYIEKKGKVYIVNGNDYFLVEPKTVGQKITYYNMKPSMFDGDLLEIDAMDEFGDTFDPGIYIAELKVNSYDGAVVLIDGIEVHLSLIADANIKVIGNKHDKKEWPSEK